MTKMTPAEVAVPDTGHGRFRFVRFVPVEIGT